MSNIYAQHDAAFSNVAAYVVMDGADRVATIAMKFPRDGAGRVYAYVHWLGMEMTRGFAGGGGYDKRSAACADAARKAIKAFDPATDNADNIMRRATFFRLLSLDAGSDWRRQLEDAGFAVFQAA